MIHDNIADSGEYKDRRKKMEEHFDSLSLLSKTQKEFESPSGNYKLTVTERDAGEGYWNYVEGVIFDSKTGEEIFTIKRNYGSFWYRWIEHQNGNEYLLCGEDYQGYVCLNLAERKKHVYFSEHGLKGWGFCWVEVEEYDKDYDDTIRVEGCFWGAQFEEVEYDFSDPDTLPYKEISRHNVDCDDDDDEEEEEGDD